MTNDERRRYEVTQFGPPATARHYKLVLFSFGLIASCSHVQTNSSSVPYRDKVVMAIDSGSHGQEIISPVNPKLALQRLLELIHSSFAIADFTPQQINKIMGVDVKFARDGSDHFGFSEAITLQWSYGFGVDKTFKDGPRFELSFDELDRSDHSPPMTEICQIDFEAFTEALEELGFTRQTFYGSHGSLGWDRFDDLRPNGRLTVEVYPRGEADEPTDKINHLCVRTVVIQ